MCEFYKFLTQKSDFRVHRHSVAVSQSVTIVILCFYGSVPLFCV
jgi:hypothetical protein